MERRHMSEPGERLPFKIEQWDDTGTQVESVLALACGQRLAVSAYEAAVRLYPGRVVTLRRGTEVLANAPASPGA
jgi:hypothetical protein